MKIEERPSLEIVPPPVSDELRRAAEEAGWPEGLVDRLGRLHFPPDVIQMWLRDQEPKRAQRGVEILERLAYGTLRLRDATYAPKDFAALVDLFANSSEDLGEWEVIVERSPDPVAQFAMQEHHRMRVLEDRGLFVGGFASAMKETFVAGRPIGAGIMSGYRIRNDFRGRGLSQVLSWLPPAVGVPYAQGQWFYIRSQNFGSAAWMNALRADVLDSAPKRDDDVPGIETFVLQYPARVYDGDATGIRKGAVSDLERCVGLINRTHDGLDLFRPYTVESLRFRLDERIWGAKPDWWGHIYGWDEFFVLEQADRIVACAGLWDKGANVRERWRLKATGAEKLIDTTALVDFGFEEGREEASAGLIAYLIGETQTLGRGYLVAPLQFLPDVAAELADREPITERRGLIWRTFDGNFNPITPADPPITRPYTDLFYW